MAKGWVLVDVRPRADFAAFHAAGSRNAELVRVVEGAGGDLVRATASAGSGKAGAVGATVRRVLCAERLAEPLCDAPPPPQMGALRVAAYSAQGVRAVETNPAFEAEVLALTKDAVGVILACASGGTLKPTTNFPDGQASRSLLAAERLLQARGGASLREPRASAITRWPAARRRRAREVPPASCTCRAGWRRGSRAGCPARATRRRGTRRRGGCRRSKGRNTSRMLPS